MGFLLKHDCLPIQHFGELAVTLFVRYFFKLAILRVYENIANCKRTLNINFYCQADHIILEIIRYNDFSIWCNLKTFKRKLIDNTNIPLCGRGQFNLATLRCLGQCRDQIALVDRVEC